MAKKICVICGKDGYMYFPFCQEHLQQKTKGEIIKCDNCDKWYIKNKGCECQAPTLKEKICQKCGKVSGKYDLCPDCYKKQTNEKSNGKEADYTRKAIIKQIDIDTTDIRKQWEAMQRCNDGHYVRSYSEVLIDNWLYDNGYVYAYEKKVFLKKNPEAILLSDFYIPEGKIYIEFFGLDNEKYKTRKEEKIKLYESNSLNLICLEQDSIKILDDIMPQLLYKFVKE